MAQDTDGTRSGDAKAEWNSMVNTKSLFLDLDEHHNTKEDKSGTAAFDERIKQALAGSEDDELYKTMKLYANKHIDTNDEDEKSSFIRWIERRQKQQSPSPVKPPPFYVNNDERPPPEIVATAWVEPDDEPVRERPLPAGWFKIESKSTPGDYYYFDDTTGHSQWVHPLDDNGAPAAAPPPQEAVSGDDWYWGETIETIEIMKFGKLVRLGKEQYGLTDDALDKMDREDLVKWIRSKQLQQVDARSSSPARVRSLARGRGLAMPAGGNLLNCW